MSLRKYWSRLTNQEPASAAAPDGLRIYAVGDVHGCLVELKRLVEAINHDRKNHNGPATFIFLGDLVDRGPDSAGVIDFLLSNPLPNGETIFLMGNHEEFLLGCYDGATDRQADWLRHGGIDTLASYGIPREAVFSRDFDLVAAMRHAIPEEHADFLRKFRNSAIFGDYFFAHAGIRPGVPLDEQAPHDLRWIRSEFTSSTADHGVVVVHGHSVVPNVERRPNRIGVDTGCYRTGRLSAVVLTGDGISVISVGSPQDE